MTRFLQIELPPQVLREARAGLPSAQEALYRAFAEPVYGLIRRLVPRRAVAEDLFQDTFVEVLQSLSRFRSEAPVGVWIRRIAVSKCLMYLRSPWNRRLLWLDAQVGQMSRSSPGGAASAFDTSIDTVDSSAARLDLQAALTRLSPTARAVLLLHDVEGYTHDEIAELFSKSASFSKSQLMRAHLRLRELLETTPEDAACTPVSTNS